MVTSNEDLIGKNEDKIAEMVIMNKDQHLLNMNSSGTKEDLESYYDMYKSIPIEDKPYAWMSNRFIGLTGSHIDTGQANLMGMLFSVDPPVRVRPREPGDDRSAGVVQQLLRYHFLRSEIYLQIVDYVQGLLIYGTAIGKVYWKSDIRKRKIKVPNMVPRFTIKTPEVMRQMNPDLPEIIPIGEKREGWKEEEKTIAEYDDPYFENCPLQDCFWDPQAVSIQDSWIVHRSRRTVSYLRSHMESKENPNGIYNKNVEKIKDIESNEQRTGYEAQDNANGIPLVPSVTRPKGGENVEVLEWWGDYDLNKDGILEPCVFTVAVVPNKDGKTSSGILIRAEENPYWHGKKPFVKSNYIRIANEFMGMGIPEKGYDSQHVINDTVNQRVDNVSFVMNRMIKYRKGSGADPKKMVSAPGAVHATEEMDGIEYERTPDVTQSAYLEVPFWERAMQQETGITNISQGVGGPGTHDTLGGLEQQQAAAGARIALVAKALEYTTIREIAQFFYELDYQFLTQEKIIRIAGKKGEEYVRVKPEDVSKEYDFEPTGVFTMENRNETALKLIQLLNIDKTANFLKVQEIYREIIISLGFDHPEKYMLTPEEQQKKQQEEQQKALAQKQAETDMETNASIKENLVNKASDEMVSDEVVGTPSVPPTEAPTPPQDRSTIPTP